MSLMLRPILPFCALGLVSCGPELGEHRLVSAKYTEALPAAVSHSRNDPGYVVLEFRTNADLNGAAINALYSEADPCNASGEGRMTTFGPFTDADAPRQLPLADDRSPTKDYLVYVPVTGEIWSDLGEDGRMPVIGSFDLRENAEDICFSLLHTGYPWATRTNVVRVAGPVLKRAIGSAAP